MTAAEQLARRVRLVAAIGEHRADDVDAAGQLDLVIDLLARAAGQNPRAAGDGAADSRTPGAAAPSSRGRR